VRGILLSGGISAFFAFFVTPVLIRFLAKKGYGQIIRDDGPTSHHVKRGTPTMGGLVLIAASLAGYLNLDDYFSATSHWFNHWARNCWLYR